MSRGFRRRIERSENQARSIGMLGSDPALDTGGEESFQTLVPKSLDRHLE